MTEIDNAELVDHKQKCRFCLKNFDSNEKHAKISREIENNFIKMTQIEVSCIE
jgi:hypothetical protein